MTLLPNPKPHGIDKSECSLLKEHYALFPPQVSYGIDPGETEMTTTNEASHPEVVGPAREHPEHPDGRGDDDQRAEDREAVGDGVQHG